MSTEVFRKHRYGWEIMVPSIVGICKFNVDGSIRGAPWVSSIGGIMRCANGVALGHFSKATWILWAFQAEVHAIMHALLFCSEFWLQNIIIESDSTLVVGWVGRKQTRPWKLMQELNQINRLMLEVNCAGVFHIFREANSKANCLAKSGCKREVHLSGLIG